MAPLQKINHTPVKPFNTISKKAIPLAIRQSLKIIFARIDEGAWLVGGTALAGYYAEHRKSDDIDIFCIDKNSHQIAIQAARYLQKQGADFSNERTTPAFYHADVIFKGRSFTLDIVLDPHLGTVGKYHMTRDKITVASLETLFAMKAACLVSRASEKDLFDLSWMLVNDPGLNARQIIIQGALVDAGMTTESLLISLKGTTLREGACHFLLDDSMMSVGTAFKRIESLRKKLISEVLAYEKSLSLGKEAESMRRNVRSRQIR